MTLLLIICDASLEERVLEKLRDMSVPGYTRIPDLTGMGRTGRREGDPIWPGTNTMLVVAIPEGLVTAVRDMLSALKREYSHAPAFRVFALGATEII
jgi:hypothetical protein